ncbi:ribonuclease H-like domain-containing protein [Amylocystis lapponica]|nr:ribonuclease H-like domain-containing protein [Amylocystis lapponica]
MTTGSLAHIFRVFTEGDVVNERPPVKGTAVTVPTLSIATDGSCFNNGADNAAAGAGGYVAENHQNNFAIRLPNTVRQSNQSGELTAVKTAAEINPLLCKLEIESDSKYALDAVTKNLQRQEDRGYIGVNNRQLIQVTVARLRQRKFPTRLKWVKGHNGHERNEAADRLAGAAAQKATPDELDLTVDPLLKISGARLSEVTQAVAYQAIRGIKMASSHSRQRTEANLVKTKVAANECFGKIPTNTHIWLSLRSKDISKKARYFLWMAMHDAYMIGDKWLRPNFSAEIQERSVCAHCGCTESMEHILTLCTAPGREEIWELAHELWSKKLREWTWPTMGSILACGLAEFLNAKGKPVRGDARLYRILVSESAHLIWKLRCERVIGHDNQKLHSQDEIRNKWLAVINDRLGLDCATASVRRYGKKAIPAKLVQSTWKGTLLKEDTLPREWVREAGVLVGIEPSQATLGIG